MSDVAPDPTPKGSGKGLKGLLGTKLGPLKIWQSLLILAFLIGGVLYFRSRKTNTGTTATTTDDGTLTGDDGTGTIEDSVSGNAGGDTTSDPSGSAAGSTNAQWAVTAANLLIGQGQNPLTVQTALSNYLNGKALTTDQKAIVTSAIQQCGSPPNGVLPVAVGDGTVAAKDTAYAVQGGDSLVSIAQSFYGDGTRWNDIYAANKTKIGGNPLTLKVAMSLTIPGQGRLTTPGAGVVRETIPKGHKYTTQYGDNYISIARKFWGSSGHAAALIKANKGIFPDATSGTPLTAGRTITLV